MTAAQRGNNFRGGRGEAGDRAAALGDAQILQHVGPSKGEANSVGTISERLPQAPCLWEWKGLLGTRHKDRAGAENAACPAAPGPHPLAFGLEALQGPEPRPHPRNRHRPWKSYSPARPGSQPAAPSMSL